MAGRHKKSQAGISINNEKREKKKTENTE